MSLVGQIHFYGALTRPKHLVWSEVLADCAAAPLSFQLSAESVSDVL